MPRNLIVIILFQAVIWCIVRILPNTSKMDKFQWITVAVMAIIYGISLDLILGNFGIFSYLPDGPEMRPVEPIELEIPLLVINSFASYGLAIATVALAANSFTVKTNRSEFWLIITGITFAIGLVGIIYLPPASIQIMVFLGMVLVSGGELLSVLNGRAGPLIALASGTSSVPFFKLWIFSTLIGVGYEVANYFFPFWIWLPGSDIPAIWLRILIIFFGYFALFHSMTILWVLLDSKKWRNNY